MIRTGFRGRILRFVPVLMALAATACSKEKSTKPTDTTPPAAITDLSTGTVNSTTVLLLWSAPGDDGLLGNADRYDVRYSFNPISEGNWETASQALGEPDPQAPGTAESFAVVGLNPNTPYFFAMKTADEQPDWSMLSNVVSAATLP